MFRDFYIQISKSLLSLLNPSNAWVFVVYAVDDPATLLVQTLHVGRVLPPRSQESPASICRALATAWFAYENVLSNETQTLEVAATP